MTAYYNENDPFAAAWLRELIKANLIAQGDVDERSIKEVQPEDLRKYTQCHFFAGIGVWSYTLRQAGWSDNQPVWTGSCPCQPFSAAGKKGGFDDTRHLWPDWFRLIRESRPDTIFGEQVASKDGLNWFDLVSTDLEGEGYAVGAADLCAAGVGAPHIRQRLYFVGHANDEGPQGRRLSGNSSDQRALGAASMADALDYAANARRQGAREYKCGSSLFAPRLEQSGEANKLADTERFGRKQGRSTVQPSSSPTETSTGASVESGRRSDISELAYTECAQKHKEQQGSEKDERKRGTNSFSGRSLVSAVNGFWANAEWIPCIDGKARPVEPGAFPLATGIKNRVGLLRGYGNSLTAPVAQTFIEAYLDILKTG